MRFGRRDPPSTARRKLNDRRQGKEPTEEYAEDIRRLVAMAYPEMTIKGQDEIAAEAFLGGYRNSRIAYQAMNGAPKTLARALELVDAYEHNYRATVGREQELATRSRARQVTWADEEVPEVRSAAGLMQGWRETRGTPHTDPPQASPGLSQGGQKTLAQHVEDLQGAMAKQQEDLQRAVVKQQEDLQRAVVKQQEDLQRAVAKQQEDMARVLELLGGGPREDPPTRLSSQEGLRPRRDEGRLDYTPRPTSRSPSPARGIGRCYQCGGEGHFRRDCPRALSPSPQRTGN